MEKLVYLLWAPSDTSLDAHRDQLLAGCAAALLEAGARGLTVNVDDSDADVPPSSKGMTGRAPFTAQVSVWVDDHGERAALEEVLRAHCARFAGYLVTESVYTDYGGNRHGRARDWQDGERSPGVLTVTLLEKPQRFAYEPWIAHWFGTQSPVSEAMQPRMRYVRNAVVRALTPGAPVYHGIVEEAWPSARHMTDPYLFYCAERFETLAENMAGMMRSVTGFLDLPRIQNVTMSEYFVRTPDFGGVL